MSRVNGRQTMAERGKRVVILILSAVMTFASHCDCKCDCDCRGSLNVPLFHAFLTRSSSFSFAKLNFAYVMVDSHVESLLSVTVLDQDLSPHTYIQCCSYSHSKPCIHAWKSVSRLLGAAETARRSASV